MFTLASLIGIFSYFIFLIGILGHLKLEVILPVTLVFLCSPIFLLIKNFSKVNLKSLNEFKKPQELSILVLLFLFAFVNLIGALGPEIFYDALWYHLTLPKLYLERGEIYHIGGNLLYYSEMPRLVEMLYTVSLSLTNEIGAKVIHYLFGIITAFAIFIYGKKIFNLKVALLATLIFYSDLSVAWQSTTAYVDLGRTFFETLGFFFFLEWFRERKDTSLMKSGVSLGLALSTKHFAFGSILILAFLIFIYARGKRILKTIKFILPALLVPLPWFITAFITTGNPVYPIFSGILDKSHDIVIRGFLNFFLDFFRLSNLPNDWISPISPIYLVFLPLTFFSVIKNSTARVVGFYVLLSYIIWFLTPRTGGSRFIMPYLPVFALFVSSIFYLKLNQLKTIQLLAISAILFLALGHLLLRTYVNGKNVPVILGWQSKHDFLVENLDFTNAFYDVDDYFERNIGKNDLVYIIGGQNLYYVNFPFTHESFGEKRSYNYVLTQYKDLPEEFGELKPIYKNPKTFVKLYKLD